MNIKIKRVYEKAAPEDGKRILIDRLWPRGIKKEIAQIDFWAKETAPSHELRKWYQHEHAKWEEFKVRYFAELDQQKKAVAELKQQLATETSTFVFSSKELELNNAHALREYLLAMD